MDKRNDVVVLRTGYLYEADMVASAFEQEGIPFYRRQVTSSGLEFAMPVAAAPAPGLFYLVLVPQQAEADARELLEELPVSKDTNPGVWEFGATPKTTRVWKFVSRFMLFWIAVALAIQSWQVLRAWFGYPLS